MSAAFTGNITADPLGRSPRIHLRNRKASIQRWFGRTAPYTCVAALFLAIAACPQAGAQTFTTLHSFNGTDGATPGRGLILDPAGNLYGTAEAGGSVNGGTVFKIDATGNSTVLHSFNGADGSLPVSTLVRDGAGNLYGTTSQGAAGYGTVFKLDPAGNETVLHTFNGSDGGWPFSGLIRDSSGNLYGTSNTGGSAGHGTIFKIDPAGNFTIIHSFTNGADGSEPSGNIILDASGNLYGTTAYGGPANLGTAFKIDPAGNETVLYRFSGADGGVPLAGVVRDAAGNLYGTTWQGGAANLGTVYKLDTAGNLTVLHSFTGMPDGQNPHAELEVDAAGNLYSTTFDGGSQGFGTVFKIDPAGNTSVLHNFVGTDGARPTGELVLDGAGNLYGTTTIGGSGGVGTVFKITGAAGFAITPFPGTVTLPHGSIAAAFLLKIDPANHFVGNVQLTCSGGPARSICGNLPPSVHVDATAYAIAWMLFPYNSTPGTYTVTFTGTTSSGAVSTSTATLNLQ